MQQLVEFGIAFGVFVVLGVVFAAYLHRDGRK